MASNVELLTTHCFPLVRLPQEGADVTHIHSLIDRLPALLDGRFHHGPLDHV